MSVKDYSKYRGGLRSTSSGIKTEDPVSAYSQYRATMNEAPVMERQPLGPPKPATTYKPVTEMDVQNRFKEEQRLHNQKLRNIERQQMGMTNLSGGYSPQTVRAASQMKQDVIRTAPTIEQAKRSLMSEQASRMLADNPNDDTAWLQYTANTMNDVDFRRYQMDPVYQQATKQAVLPQIRHDKLVADAKAKIGPTDTAGQIMLQSLSDWWLQTRATGNTLLGVAGNKQALQRGAEQFGQAAINREATVGRDLSNQFLYDLTSIAPDMLSMVGIGAGFAKAGVKVGAQSLTKATLKGLMAKETRNASLKAIASAMAVSPETVPLGAKIFAQGYQENLAEGMDDKKAFFTAFVNAYGQSLLEKGGINKLIGLEGGKTAAVKYLKAAFGEGAEEVTQDMWESAVDKLIAGRDVKLYSSDPGERSFINPERQLYSFALGATAGGGMAAGMAGVNLYDQKTKPVVSMEDPTQKIQQYEADRATYEQQMQNFQVEPQAEPVQEPVSDEYRFARYSPKELVHAAKQVAQEAMVAERDALIEASNNVESMEEWEGIQSAIDRLTPETIVTQVQNGTASTTVLDVVKRQAYQFKSKAPEPKVTNPMAKLQDIKIEEPKKPEMPDIMPTVDTSKMSPALVAKMNEDIASLGDKAEAVLDMATEGKTRSEIVKALDVPPRAVRAVLTMNGVPDVKSPQFEAWKAVRTYSKGRQAEAPKAQPIEPDEMQRRVDNVRSLKESGATVVTDLDPGHAYAQKLGKLLGVDVVFYEGGKQAVQGVYTDRENRTIFLNRKYMTDAESTMSVLGHEFLHSVRTNHLDLYNTLREVIGDGLTSEKVQRQIERYSADKDYQNLIAQDQDLMIEEILADEAGSLFTDKEFWNNVYEKDATAFQKLVRLLRDFINRVLDDVRKQSDSFGVLTEVQMKDFQKRFEGAVADIMKRAETEGVTEADMDKEAPRFSVVKGEKNLVALHNIWPSKLEKAIELGGFPVPSIAVTKEDVPFTDFGSITLVGTKDMVDPANPENKVYDTDVYSRRMPDVYRNVDQTKLNKIRSQFDSSFAEFDESAYSYLNVSESNNNDPERFYERLADMLPMRVHFLRKIKGKKVDIAKRPVTFETSVLSADLAQKFIQENPGFSWKTSSQYRPQMFELMSRSIDEYGKGMETIAPGAAESVREGFRKKYLDDREKRLYLSYEDQVARDLSALQQGKSEIDRKATRDNTAMNPKTEKEFMGWLEETFSPIYKDSFFYHGERKKPLTLENVFNYMKGDVKNTEGFNYGAGSAKARGAVKFKNVEQMHKDKHTISTEEEVEQFKEQFQEKFNNLVRDLDSRSDNTMDAIGDYLGGATPETALKRNLITADKEQVSKFKALADELDNAPVRYYEAKPQRIIRFEDFAAAIVPKDLNKSLVQKLQDVGVQKIIKYDPTDENGRVKAIEKTKKLDSVRFKITAEHTTPHDFDKFDHSKMGTGEGAQVYGWGTYLSTSDQVREFYRKQFQLKEEVASDDPRASWILVDGKPILESFPNFSDRVAGLLYQTLYDNRDKKPAKIYDKILGLNGHAGADARALYRAIKDNGYELLDPQPVEKKKSSVKTLKVDVDAEIEHMLDWDKPMEGQSEYIQNIFNDNPSLWGAFDNENATTGRDLYEGLQRLIVAGEIPNAPRTAGNYAESASKYLNSIGIPGIKYLDGMSRRKGDGSYNFVIFDENKMHITEKYKLKEEDTTGKAVSREQQKYFEGTKAQKQGKLIRLYHGTAYDNFNEIESEGPFYLAEDRAYAGVYINPEVLADNPELRGRIMEGYALIKNPINVGEMNAPIDSDEDLEPLAALLRVNLSEIKKIESEADEPYFVWGLVNTPRFKKLAQSKGFDGLTAIENGKRTWAVFKSNQFKEATNYSPTSNADIRYKLKEEPTGTPSIELSMEESDAPKELWKKVKDFYRIRLADKNAPIREADEKAYRMASNAASVSGAVEHILTESLVDKNGDYVDKSWAEVTAPFAENLDFWQYMVQLHNIDRAREGKPVDPNMSPYQSKMYVKQADKAHPEYRGWAEDVTGWINRFMDTWAAGDTVSQDLMDELRETYPHYWPTNREFTDLEGGAGMGPGKRFVDLQAPIKRATGSERAITNPVGNVAMMVNKVVRTAKYNEVGKALLESVRANPDKMKPFAEEVPAKIGMFTRLDNIVSVWEDGQPQYLQINNEELLKSLMGLPKIINNAAAVRKVTNIYKGLITYYNPFFAIRNIFRDIPTAYVYGSQDNPLFFLKDLAKAGYQIATGTGGAAKYKALGGGASGQFTADEAAKYAKLLQPSATKNPLMRMAKSGLKGIEFINNLTEQAPRIAEFNHVLEQTGDVQKALFAAQNVTVNFARGGDVAKQIEPFVPYFNASVQGIDRFFQAFDFKNDPQSALKRMVKAGIAVTIPQIVSYMLSMADDEDNYKALDQRTKDTNYVFPKGDGTYWKVPKSRELGVLFASLFERVASGYGFEGYGNLVRTNFSPVSPFENNIMSPLLYNLPMNKDFAGRSIVPQYMLSDARSPKLQYDDNTSEIAKAIGEKTGLSPKQLDYIMRSYTGVLGQFALPAATQRAGAGSAFKRITVGAFEADPAFSSQAMTNFYDRLDELKTAKTDRNLKENLKADIVTPEEKLYNAANKMAGSITRTTKYINQNLKADDPAVADIRRTLNKYLEKASKADRPVDFITLNNLMNVELRKQGVR